LSKKKTLFITNDGLTDPLGQSQILPYLVGLSKKYKITIVSSEKKGNYEENKMQINEIVKKAGIQWVHFTYRSSIPILSPYLNYRSLLKKARSVCKNYSIELVHCRSIIPAMVGNKLKKQFNTSLLFDIRGFWADERVEGKLWNLKNPIFRFLYNFFKRKEKYLFQKADGIITLTENAKEYILKNFQTNRNFAVIPCSVDIDHFSKLSLDISKQLGIRELLQIDKDAYVLGYIGSLGTRYRLKDMLAFYKELKKQEENAILFFVTKTPADFIYKHLKPLDISELDVRIISSDYSHMPSYIDIMNASMFFVTVGFSGKAVSPTKQSEVLSMGKPIVANAGLGDTDIILKEYNLGVLVDSFEVESLKKAATKLLNTSFDAEEIRNTAIQEFSLHNAINSYEKIYSKLIGDE
jgi:glycosyltransferase involved in cell wall biosynthesis